MRISSSVGRVGKVGVQGSTDITASLSEWDDERVSIDVRSSRAWQCIATSAICPSLAVLSPTPSDIQFLLRNNIMKLLWEQSHNMHTIQDHIRIQFLVLVPWLFQPSSATTCQSHQCPLLQRAVNACPGPCPTPHVLALPHIALGLGQGHFVLSRSFFSLYGLTTYSQSLASHLCYFGCPGEVGFFSTPANMDGHIALCQARHRQCARLR